MTTSKIERVTNHKESLDAAITSRTINSAAIQRMQSMQAALLRVHCMTIIVKSSSTQVHGQLHQ